MSNGVSVVQPKQAAFSDIERVLIHGDLSQMPSQQKIAYYQKVCETVGLNPLTKPFEYIKLNGKEVLYATKGCAEQLRMRHKISIRITARETIEGVYVVTAEAADSAGRVDSSTGAVSTKGLAGDALANAMMKAETKAKRRVTLSISGLNMLDETEVETINPHAASSMQPEQGDGHTSAGAEPYIIPFGKYAKRGLEEVDLNDLRSYVDYIEKKAEKNGEKLKGQVLDFVERAVAHIAAFENGNAGLT